MIFCQGTKNPARRRYLQGCFTVMACYMLLVVICRWIVDRTHPQGAPLFFTAALPTLPLIVFAWIVGRYLREERDDYQRDIVIRGMLWGTAASLSITIFAGFLRAYGWTGTLPPFLEFMVFWAVAGAVKAIYFFINRAGADE